MKYAIQKLKTEIKTKEQEIRDLKSILRESHQPRKTETKFLWQEKPPRYEWGTQDALFRAKMDATALYQLRAHMRGRVHRKGDTLECQAEAIGSKLATYELTDAASSAA